MAVELPNLNKPSEWECETEGCGKIFDTFRAARAHETQAHGDRRTIQGATVEELLTELRIRLPNAEITINFPASQPPLRDEYGLLIEEGSDPLA